MLDIDLISDLLTALDNISGFCGVIGYFFLFKLDILLRKNCSIFVYLHTGIIGEGNG